MIGFAFGRKALRAERVLVRPGARGVDDRAGKVAAQRAVAATDGQHEGRVSRALLVTLSMPCRLMRVTFAPVSMTAAISGVSASGSR